MMKICPVCCGDGGVRGGCYKCDGSGWVASASSTEYRGSAERLMESNDISRASNTNLLATNHEAPYKDYDGGLGPTDHDNRADEGDA